MLCPVLGEELEESVSLLRDNLEGFLGLRRMWMIAQQCARPWVMARKFESGNCSKSRMKQLTEERGVEQRIRHGFTRRCDVVCWLHLKPSVFGLWGETQGEWPPLDQ